MDGGFTTLQILHFQKGQRCHILETGIIFYLHQKRFEHTDLHLCLFIYNAFNANVVRLYRYLSGVWKKL